MAGFAQKRRRDYSLVGPDTAAAIEQGLTQAEWYHSEVPRKVMKELMQRSDGRALRDAALWLGGLIVSGGLAAVFWGTWWCIPFFIVYGTLYGSASDARWHECGHGTAFRTRWMNDVLYQIASFMQMRNPVTWRWSHARHHTDTLIVGRDAEIAVMRPPDLARLIANFFGLVDVFHLLPALLRNALGSLSLEEKTFIPEMEWSKTVRVARIHMMIYAATIVLALYFGSFLPLLLVGLPRLYGAWHMVLVGLLQHGGLADNVTDHRLNTRTVLINPVSRFIYLNMNYHVEHHMFPMVPYHALPRLHELIKHDLPVANSSMWQAYREMIPVLLRQLRNEEHFLKRELPPGARSYLEWGAKPE